MKKFLILFLLGAASPASAQCLSIPNGNTQALVWSVFDGKPFSQQTLEDAMPVLNRYGIALTPPNAVGEKTKVGDPISTRWTRVGFGEGHPVWIQQADRYVLDPALCGTTPIPPTPSPSPEPPVLIDYARIREIVREEVHREVGAPADDTVHAQNERVYADLVKRDEAISAQITALDSKAGGALKVLGDVATFAAKYIAPAVGAWIAAKKIGN